MFFSKNSPRVTLRDRQEGHQGELHMENLVGRREAALWCHSETEIVNRILSSRI